MKNITDVWFRTDLGLRVLAEKMGVEEINHDAENYWEWITGFLGKHYMNISRSHSEKAINTDTRIFSNGEFEEKFISLLKTKLQVISITPIYFGKWNYTKGDEFEPSFANTVSASLEPS